MRARDGGSPWQSSLQARAFRALAPREVHESVARLLLNQAIKPAQRKALAAIQQPAGAGQSYAPQSGQIYGSANVQVQLVCIIP